MPKRSAACLRTNFIATSPCPRRGRGRESAPIEISASRVLRPAIWVLLLPWSKEGSWGLRSARCSICSPVCLRQQGCDPMQFFLRKWDSVFKGLAAHPQGDLTIGVEALPPEAKSDFRPDVWRPYFDHLSREHADARHSFVGHVLSSIGPFAPPMLRLRGSGVHRMLRPASAFSAGAPRTSYPEAYGGIFSKRDLRERARAGMECASLGVCGEGRLKCFRPFVMSSVVAKGLQSGRGGPLTPAGARL